MEDFKLKLSTLTKVEEPTRYSQLFIQDIIKVFGICVSYRCHEETALKEVVIDDGSEVITVLVKSAVQQFHKVKPGDALEVTGMVADDVEIPYIIADSVLVRHNPNYEIIYLKETLSLCEHNNL